MLELKQYFAEGKKSSVSEINWHNIRIEDEKRSVFFNNELIALTPKEYQLFIYLVQNRGIILERETIYQRIWESPSEPDSRTLDLHSADQKETAFGKRAANDLWCRVLIGGIR